MVSTMADESMADSRIPERAWPECAWPAGATSEGVQPPGRDPEQFEDHLRPAWHVVAATAVVLAASVVVSWLGH